MPRERRPGRGPDVTKRLVVFSQAPNDNGLVEHTEPESRDQRYSEPGSYKSLGRPVLVGLDGTVWLETCSTEGDQRRRLTAPDAAHRLHPVFIRQFGEVDDTSSSQAVASGQDDPVRVVEEVHPGHPVDRSITALLPLEDMERPVVPGQALTRVSYLGAFDLGLDE